MLLSSLGLGLSIYKMGIWIPVLQELEVLKDRIYWYKDMLVIKNILPYLPNNVLYVFYK